MICGALSVMPPAACRFVFAQNARNAHGSDEKRLIRGRIHWGGAAQCCKVGFQNLLNSLNSFDKNSTRFPKCARMCSCTYSDFGFWAAACFIVAAEYDNVLSIGQGCRAPSAWCAAGERSSCLSRCAAGQCTQDLFQGRMCSSCCHSSVLFSSSSWWRW